MLVAGDAVAAAATIEVTIKAIEDIAKTTVGQAEQDASSAFSQFGGAPVSTAAFSEVPLAQELAAQHKLAHEVYTDTVKGVVADLRDFQDKLLACAKAHEGNDDGVYATLVAVGKRYRHHEYHTQQNYDRSLRRHGGRRTDTPENATGAGSSGSGDQPASQAAAATQQQDHSGPATDGNGF